MLFGFAWAWPLKVLFKATLCFPRFGQASNEEGWVGLNCMRACLATSTGWDQDSTDQVKPSVLGCVALCFAGASGSERPRP